MAHAALYPPSLPAFQVYFVAILKGANELWVQNGQIDAIQYVQAWFSAYICLLRILPQSSSRKAALFLDFSSYSESRKTRISLLVNDYSPSLVGWSTV
jgi:hypothetical protein